MLYAFALSFMLAGVSVPFFPSPWWSARKLNSSFRLGTSVHFLSVYFFSVFTRSPSGDYGRALLLANFWRRKRHPFLLIFFFAWSLSYHDPGPQDVMCRFYKVPGNPLPRPPTQPNPTLPRTWTVTFRDGKLQNPGSLPPAAFPPAVPRRGGVRRFRRTLFARLTRRVRPYYREYT